MFKVYCPKIMSLSCLQQLKALHSNLDDLATVLHQISNDPQALAALPAVVASCPTEQVERWCEYCLETLNADVGGVLITAISTGQKAVLQQSSSICMQVALIGEYGTHDWIETLQTHWPEIIHQCLDNAVRIFEKRAVEEKNLLGLMPSILKDALITVIQEKVLRNYMECLTSDQLTRYLEANVENNREADPVLRSYHEHKLLTQATKDLGTEPYRRIKL